MAQKEKQITKLTIIKNIYSKVNPKISAKWVKNWLGHFIMNYKHPICQELILF